MAIAAGPWSADLIPLPVSALWGVVVEFELPDPPRHVLEEAGIDVLTGADGIPDVLFSAVTARGISAVGSTFLTERPDPDALAPRIVANATRFLPALAGAQPRGLRACARPISADGRPYLGLALENLAVATGHGAWGITLGPASARLVADQLLGRPAEIPPALSASRLSRLTSVSPERRAGNDGRSWACRSTSSCRWWASSSCQGSRWRSCPPAP